MGKSTASAMLRRLGVPLFDADAAVHRLLSPSGAAVGHVEAAFPGVRDAAGGIDRPALGRRVFGRPDELRRLERILHPIVRAAEKKFIATSRGRRDPVIVLDIPLLFETHAERLCDGVIVVSAPRWLQRQRVMRRPGMTDSRLRSILAAQIPDREKRRRADFVVPTGLSKAHTLRHLRAVLRLVGSGYADSTTARYRVSGGRRGMRRCGRSS